MKKNIFGISCCVLLLLSLGIGSIPATTRNQITPVEQLLGIDDEPPMIEIVNPTEGYFHFSGIKLFPTIFNIVADTMGFGGFRVRPVQVSVTDNVDAPEDILVYMYVYENEQGNMTWNSDRQLHERQWIGPDLGVFTMNISAQDTTGNTASVEMSVWYYCFIPE
ncbi:MAG TPA: hypothetical protein VN365_01555 [Candidatus Thermoplasmatota archaeon]|nr:hypothetical protein [Candidatus Thermoplasmatota archaeon]